ncbi:relaxase/mobilization nuclease domain-containing protein [Methylobacterium sp. NPDC080182]|uniref:relaxase/mobilization nuclease domain-containing protein n=1 Tax=Methylobacterium sp. NPDC080182 TaxID=3390590 RepID=UPI003D0542A1
MISGAMRGRGGDALAKHLLKPENDSFEVIPARGLGSNDLIWQLRELVALSSAGRTDRPVYHVHVDPEGDIGDEAAARTRWWSLFEREFGLDGQAYCGAVHVKHGRRHEHRVYSLVRPSGAVVDIAWDYARREKVSRIVEFEHGLAPVPSKHARAIERALRDDGRPDVADWLVASGSTAAERPVAVLSPVERLIQERTGVTLDDVRRAALDAWRASMDGPGFEAALARHGLRLAAGRSGPVIVDGSGTPRLATRLLGAAGKRFEGSRIPAATVRARIEGLQLREVTDGHDGDHAPARRAGPGSARDRGDARPAGGRGDGVGIRRPDRDTGRPDGGGGRRRGVRPVAALGRLRALPVAGRLRLTRRLRTLDPRLDAFIAAGERARAAIERIEEEGAYERERAWALFGVTDIWGIPIR